MSARNRSLPTTPEVLTGEGSPAAGAPAGPAAEDPAGQAPAAVLEETAASPPRAPAPAPEPPSGYLRYVHRYAGLLEVGVLAIVLLVLVLDVGVVVANMLDRYFDGHPIVWADQASETVLSVLAFLGGAVAYRRGRHMSISPLARGDSRLRSILRTASSMQVAALSLYVAWAGWPSLQTARDQQIPFLNLSTYWGYLPLFIGAALIVIFAVEKLLAARLRELLPALGISVVLALVVYGLRQLDPAGVTVDSGIWLAFIALVVLAVEGLPLAFAFIASAVVLFYTTEVSPMTNVTLTMAASVQSFVLSAIPFFLLAGFLLASSGLAIRLGRVIGLAAHRSRSGYMYSLLTMTFLFSGMTGAKVADVAVVGSTLNPVMRQQGYSAPEIASALSASAAAATIPPSIALIVLGSVTSLSISQLFVGGVLPALCIGACLAIVMMISGLRRVVPQKPPEVEGSWLRDGLWSLPVLSVPVVLIGGMLAGIGTPTEISAFAVVLALVLMLVYRGTSVATLRTVATETCSTMGMVLMLLAGAGVFSQALTLAGATQSVGNVFSDLASSHVLFFVVTILVLIVVGSLVEGLPALLVLGPILVPVATAHGISGVQFGIVFVACIGVGAFLPPFGAGMFTASSLSGASISDVYRPMAKYVAALLVGIAVVAAVPWLTSAL